MRYTMCTPQCLKVAIWFRWQSTFDQWLAIAWLAQVFILEDINFNECLPSTKVLLGSSEHDS